MRVYINIKDNLPVNVDIQNAIDGFEYIGYDVYTYTFTDILAEKYKNIYTKYPFVGSIDSMTKLFKTIGKYPDPIDFPTEILNNNLLNREVKKTKLKDVISLYKENKENVFIKPVKTKLFDGILISDESHLHYFNNVYNDIDVWISSEINIISEWRVYIHNNEIVYASNYKGDFKIIPDYNYVNNLITNYKNSPVSYTIDIGILKDLTNTVIEFNDFWAIGSYGLDPISYANMLNDRYFEIINK